MKHSRRWSILIVFFLCFISLLGELLFFVSTDMSKWESNNWMLALLIFQLVFLFGLFIVFIKHQGHFEKMSKTLKEDEKYRAVIEHTNAAIIQFDLNGKVQIFNHYAQRLFGYTFTEVAGKNIIEILYPHHHRSQKRKKPNSELWLRRIIQNISNEYYGENWNLTKQGKKVFVGWTSKPKYDDNGKLAAIISIGIDITEKKIMQNRVEENERKFRKIYNSMTDGIVILSQQGEILDVNASILNVMGFSSADLASDPDKKFIFRKLFPNLINRIHEVNTKGEILFDVDFENKAGNLMALEVRANKIYFQDQEAIIAVGRNITEKKHNQHQVFNTALMIEERERSRVAKELHDSVSPLLSTIKLYVQTLRDCDEPDTQQLIIERTEQSINESIQTITEISNNLSPHILENFGLIEAIKSIIDKMQESKHIEISFTYDDDSRYKQDIEIVCYRVVTELLNNTLKHACASKVFINLMHANHLLILNFADNGKGLNLDEIVKTSKGMGLYNISNRVNSIDGKINFEGKEGEGLKVVIEIPV